MAKAAKFIKENVIWLTIISAFIIISVIYGVWSANHPILSFESGDGPAVEAMVVTKGTEVFPPRANELSYKGFTLEGWYTDAEFTERYNGGSLEKSMTVYANWQPVLYTVTFRTSVGEIVGENPVKTEHDTALEYTPEVVGSTYKFQGWYLDPEFTVPCVSGETVITENTNVWAKHNTPTTTAENINAPVIHINTTRKINKDYYISCNVVVEYDDMEYSYQPLSAQVRGRGNSTWNFDKKPYRIKFNDKVDLFGMGKARDWVFLANTMDMSMLRNLTVYRMAQQFEGLESTTDCEFAHVYINDDYQGLYLIVEQVEEGKNRVEIGDGLDGDDNVCAPEDMGFLLECGRGGDSSGGQRVFYPKSFGSVETDHVVIKSPDSWVLTDKHVDYIKKYYEDVQKAIANDDFDTLCELVDIQSFVDSFICTEYVLAGDMGYDYFAYKELGGKLFLGPLWDYDQSAGSSEHGGKNYRSWNAADPHPWYVKLIKNEQFRQLVIDSWMEHYDYIHGIPDMLYGIADYYSADIDLNYDRWKGFLGSAQWRSPREIIALKTYPEHVDYYIKWLGNRVKWIEDELGITTEE